MGCSVCAVSLSGFNLTLMGIGLVTVGDGRGEMVGLAVLPVRGGRVGVLGFAITSLSD
jgi:hypothetical protein